MSRTSARHRKPSHFSSSHRGDRTISSGHPSDRPATHPSDRPATHPSDRPATHPSGARAQHRKSSPVRSALRSRPAQIGVLATVGAAVIAVPAAQAMHLLPESTTRATAMYQDGSSLGQQLRDQIAQASPSASASHAQAPSSPAASSPPAHAAPAAPEPVYRNPLRDVSGLVLERVDMGADFGGSGPVYAVGDGVITSATSDSGGWPGGGWITYQLTDGPAAGLEVYVAEDVQPTVSVGQHVTSATVIGNMFNAGDGIETGWAQPDGSSAESQLAAAGGISGGGPFPTEVGLNFDALLQELGVPAAPNYGQTGYGTLPSGYPANWNAALEP